MSNTPIPAGQTAMLNTIHKVEGFDPSAYAIDYTDLNTGETRKRLPVMAQMAWFRLVYREGKISVTVTPGKDCFVATARVYPSYKDPADCFLAEATASRGYDPAKPSVSPREWAQTAAVGIALRNAGFGLQFGAAGDDFASQVPNELCIVMDPIPQNLDSHDETGVGESHPAAITPSADPPKELTPEQKFQQASNVMWPTKKHSGRTLGEVLHMDPTAINWLANKYTGNPEVSAAAKFMCEYAMGRVGA